MRILYNIETGVEVTGTVERTDQGVEVILTGALESQELSVYLGWREASSGAVSRVAAATVNPISSGLLREYSVEFGEGYLDAPSGTNCIICLVVARNSTHNSSGYRTDYRTEVVEFEPPKALVAGGQPSIELVRSFESELELAESGVGDSGVLITSDRAGNLVLIMRENGEVVRENISSMARGAMPASTASVLLSGKADRGYVDTELAKKATTAQLATKADRSALEDLSQALANLAIIVEGKADK